MNGSTAPTARSVLGNALADEPRGVTDYALPYVIPLVGASRRFHE